MATNNDVNSIYLPLAGGTMTGNIAFNPTTAGLTGTTAADNASAGTVGEMISSNIAFASKIAFNTSTTAQTLTSVSLTAGDWDVWGNIVFSPDAGTTFTEIYGGISTTNNTLPDISLQAIRIISFSSTSNSVIAPYQRVNVNSTTTVYIVGNVKFAVSTMKFSGGIYARRRR